MSQAKRMLEAEETRRDAAIRIAIVAKVLHPCENHPDILLDSGEDIQGAYRIGNAKFSAGELSGIFDSRRQMTDAIKAVVSDHPLEDCPICEKMLAD